MKTILTLIAAIFVAAPLSANELPNGTFQLPMSLVCGEQTPLVNKRIYDRYGERPFVEGIGEMLSPDISKAYSGNVVVYLDGDDGSFTILIEIPSNVENTMLSCLVTTGKKLEPVVYGESL